MNAKEIFDELKSNAELINDEGLENFKTNLIIHAEQFKSAGQKKALERLLFLLKCVPLEKVLIDHGVNKVIYRDNIMDFLARREIQESDIKLIELEEYTRPVPSELIDIKIDIEKTFKEKFPEEKIELVYYVLFTDYTGVIEKESIRQKKIETKEKDPILFLSFQETSKNSMTRWQINDRLYVVGDWIDEYCDLTLDKLISLTSQDIVKDIVTPETQSDIIAELERYNDDGKFKEAEFKPKKKFLGSFFHKVFSFWKK